MKLIDKVAIGGMILIAIMGTIAVILCIPATPAKPNFGPWADTGWSQGNVIVQFSVAPNSVGRWRFVTNNIGTTNK